MKKYFFISAAAILALAACTKVTMGDEPDAQREVSFEVAKYVQTKANVKYDTEETFGTYAWFDNGTGAAEWMVNEPVGFAGGVWKTTEHTYYWPKTGKADFISYSPFAGEANKRPVSPTQQGSTVSPATNVTEEEAENPVPEPVITREVKDDKSVAYTIEYGKFAPYRVNGSKYDLMYADLATVSSDAPNYPIIDEIKDDERSDSGYKGVPTLFRHALANISFQIRTNFVTYTDQETGKTTEWEVTLQEAVLENLYHSGTRKLELGADKKWSYPGDPNDTGVWTFTDETENLVLYSLPVPEEVETGADGGQNEPQGETQEETAVDGMPLTTAFQPLLEDYFVLPQILGTSYPDQYYAQRLHLKVHIRTKLASNQVINEDYEPEFDLSELMTMASSEDKIFDAAWKMNQKFIYKISIKPTAMSPGDDPDTPENVLITFDPAQADWETIETNAVIQL